MVNAIQKHARHDLGVMILGCGHVDTNDASCVVMQA